MLRQNTLAKDFTLLDKDNNTVSLSSFRGKKVVLYFYPKDNTPGCSKQACSYRDNYDFFKENNTVIIGISKDSIQSHIKFVEKYDLPFILLSDPELQVIKDYEAYGTKNMYGKQVLGVIRTTYLIDENGLIIYANNKVKASEDALTIKDLYQCF